MPYFQIGDTRAGAPGPLIKSTSSGWADRTTDPGDIAPKDG